MARILAWGMGVCAALLTAIAWAQPTQFLFVGAGDLARYQALLSRPDIAGAQVVYNWKALEPSKGQYDFSAIQHDLSFMQGLHKKLFIQIQDRFFTPEARYVPDYLLIEPIYHGGLVSQVDNPGENRPQAQGWVAQQWNPAVQQRYQALLKALGRAFDGKVYGVNLPETAIDIDQKHDRSGFSCDRYFNAELENMRIARMAFKQSLVVQYVNFWPCEWNNDHRYMQRLFAFAANRKIGLGGPDVVPYKRTQMKNAYPFFHQYRGKLPVIAMAIQEPTLSYINPQTKHPFSKAEIVDFAENYLGATILFWTPQSPWLKP